MKNKSKSLLTMLGILFSIITVSPAQANIDDLINDGIAYLEASQDESGFWGVAKETPYRDAAVVVDVLGQLDVDYDVDAEVLETGNHAVYYTSTTSTDYLARKIIAEASTNEGEVSQYLIDDLVARQNADGGWGYDKYYGSNALETALAMRALVAAAYVDLEPSVFTPASSYLVSCQHSNSPDFGWGFVDGDNSKVFFTAHAVIALSALQSYDANYDFSDEIADAFSWLQTVIDDGGFGSNGSNAYETGLAIAAMVAHDPAAQEIEDAWGYLESTQSQDGSWGDDAYSTAMALYGLHCIDPANFPFEYLPGDANMGNGVWPPRVTGSDVTYMVNYFKSYPCCPGCKLDGFWASGDINGDCAILGSDVTRLQNYFRGIATISYCPDYPPAWPTIPELPPSAPPGWPNCDVTTVSKIIIPGHSVNPSDNPTE